MALDAVTDGRTRRRRTRQRPTQTRKHVMRGTRLGKVGLRPSPARIELVTPFTAAASTRAGGIEETVRRGGVADDRGDLGPALLALGSGGIAISFALRERRRPTLPAPRSAPTSPPLGDTNRSRRYRLGPGRQTSPPSVAIRCSTSTFRGTYQHSRKVAALSLRAIDLLFEGQLIVPWVMRPGSRGGWVRGRRGRA